MVGKCKKHLYTPAALPVRRGSASREAARSSWQRRSCWSSPQLPSGRGILLVFASWAPSATPCNAVNQAHCLGPRPSNEPQRRRQHAAVERGLSANFWLFLWLVLLLVVLVGPYLLWPPHVTGSPAVAVKFLSPRLTRYLLILFPSSITSLCPPSTGTRFLQQQQLQKAPESSSFSSL